jgi:3-oxoacyl-[acyl-carrier-protein] synthase III
MYPDGPSKGFHLVREGNAAVQMKGNDVYKVAVNTMAQLVAATLKANDLSKSDLDWLIPHQANIRIIEAIAKRLDLPMERVIVTIADHGNTSAASVPLALDTGVRDGRPSGGLGRGGAPVHRKRLAKSPLSTPGFMERYT